MIAEFTGPEPLVEATKSAFAAGYRKLDAYTPFPVHGLAEAMGRRGIRIPLIVLAGRDYRRAQRLSAANLWRSL